MIARSAEHVHDVERANREFWDELCGTRFARSLGITDDSLASLARYDRWYFEFYPYLERYIPFAGLAGKSVLEVGLGYGSVSQRLAEHGAIYSGLDIAAGPVAMVRRRLAMVGRKGDVRQGSILEAPFADGSFDFIVAIGCYHHTGDMARAFGETYRLLAPGGRAVVMVYNALSYRRWMRTPWMTLRRLLRGAAGGNAPTVSARERGWYDTNSSGMPAPMTEFVSTAELPALASQFAEIVCSKENAETSICGIPIGRRRWWLNTLGRLAGLDLYVSLSK
jgi:SAM-dependent methyltransferase